MRKREPVKYALYYADKMKLRVFPCYPASKIPATMHGCLEATTDTEKVKEWWSNNDNYIFVVNWNQAEKVAYLYSHDLPLIRKLEQWSKEHPDECRLERTSHEGQAVDYIIPKSWVHIYPPRKSAPLTEERKEQLREQLSAVRRGQ